MQIVMNVSLFCFSLTSYPLSLSPGSRWFKPDVRWPQPVRFWDVRIYLLYFSSITLSPSLSLSLLLQLPHLLNQFLLFSIFQELHLIHVKYILSQLNYIQVIFSQIYLWTQLKHSLISYIHSFVPLSVHDQIRFRGVLPEWAVIFCSCPGTVLTHSWCCCCQRQW